MTWKKKGNRIRASDKSLVYHFCIGWLLLLFVAVFMLLNLREFFDTDWKNFNLLHAGITWTAYNSISISTTFHMPKNKRFSGNIRQYSNL